MLPIGELEELIDGWVHDTKLVCEVQRVLQSYYKLQNTPGRMPADEAIGLLIYHVEQAGYPVKEN